MPSADPARLRGSTRRDPYVLLLIAAALLVARVATGVWEQRHPGPVSSLVAWVPAEQAEQRSRETGRPILYDFSAEWCGPCQQMEHDVFAVENRARTIDQLVVPVRVVDRSREEGHNPSLIDSLQHAYQVSAFPTLVVVSNGRELDRQVGFNGASKMQNWLSRTSVRSRLMPAPLGSVVDSTKRGRSFRFSLP
jgi:thiol:disulfide interchange protein